MCSIRKAMSCHSVTVLSRPARVSRVEAMMLSMLMGAHVCGQVRWLSDVLQVADGQVYDLVIGEPAAFQFGDGEGVQPIRGMCSWPASRMGHS
ncbi:MULTISPECIES: hypothetical protein [unclassified Arthrobacter]|uniref:hypothetical protein n=1 Tax=unclassified Arthrobacter TaxID=235627 RepID=UPI001F2CDD14|nr:hypothetical protein [Arthrobacter sp. FW305-BF8]UKA56150.1 hypothetical protein LFT45_09675 [Arthrobacter sp. FW305-BF8]